MVLHFAAFPDLQLETGDFEKAARFFNACRRHGVQGSNTDFLICSVADRRNLEIFTLDNDFLVFRKYIPVKLHSPRARTNPV
jgi:predicted nucleic acid-binding protein